MNGRIIKSLFFIVGFLAVSAFSPFNGSADISAIPGFNSAVKQESLILERDNTNDRIKGYETNINGQRGDENLPTSGDGGNSRVKDQDDIPVNVPDSGFKNPGIDELELRLRAEINTLEIKDWVELINDDSGLRLEVQLPILFASGSSKTTGSYDGFFKKIAALVKPHDAFIHVRGTTDELKSKKISNIDLGAKRAASIVNRLVHYGLPPSIFKITSRGEYQQDLHPDKKNPSLKRRAEITVYFNG